MFGLFKKQKTAPKAQSVTGGNFKMEIQKTHTLSGLGTVLKGEVIKDAITSGETLTIVLGDTTKPIKVVGTERFDLTPQGKQEIAIVTRDIAENEITEGAFVKY